MYRIHPKGTDDYETPGWATTALMKRERFNGLIWEPACGRGKMSEILKTYNKVYSSDIIDYGYGKVENFLKSKRNVPNIVTNPPYSFAEEFIKQSLKLSNYKIALLLKINFMASRRRYFELWKSTPLKKILIFCRRISFLDPITKKGSHMLVHCWAIWDKQWHKGTVIDWIED